jgi:hypothetical protein
MDEGTICEFRNASFHEVVEVEWDRAIRNSFVSEDVSLNILSFRILKKTHTWFSGQTMFSPRGVSNSHNLKNSHWQSLAANPPTSTTCWKLQKMIDIKTHIYCRMMCKTDRDRFMCSILLFKECFDNTINRRLKELCNISPKTINRNISDILILWTHPINFNWPKRMLQLSSLSLVDPNLTYSGSSAFLNRSLVVLSKQRMIWSRSSRKGESLKRSRQRR